MSRWVKIGLGLAAVLSLPLAVGGLRSLMSQDPFGYFGARWADPFGGDVGSVMTNVDAQVFEKGQKKASFSAKGVEIRRDKQQMTLSGLTEGKIFDNNKEQASFSAGRANYNAAKELMMIVGGAHVKGADFDIRAPEAKVDIANKRAVMPKGVEGRALSGAIRADKLELGLGSGKHRATNVEWRGKPSIEGIPQGREVQFRAEDVEYTSDPNIVIYKNAEAVDEDALMRAKVITYDGAKDIVTLEGGAEYYGSEVIVSAPKVVVHRKQKRAIANGGVYFLVKAEGEKGIPVAEKQPAQPVLPKGLAQPQDFEDLRNANNLRKYPIIVTSNAVEYFYQKGAKKAVMTGEPKAHQQLRAGVWREVTAPRAEFEEEKDVLNLFSTGDAKEVRMKNSAGDDFIALSVRIGTVQGKETLSGKLMEGVMKVREEEVPKVGGDGGGG